jgi:hypothetical protein
MLGKIFQNKEPDVYYLMVTVLGSTQGTFCSSEKGGSGGAALRWVSAHLPYKFCHPTMVLLHVRPGLWK